MRAPACREPSCRQPLGARSFPPLRVTKARAPTINRAIANPIPDSQAKTGSTCPLVPVVRRGRVTWATGTRPPMPRIVVVVVGAAVVIGPRGALLGTTTGGGATTVVVTPARVVDEALGRVVVVLGLVTGMVEREVGGAVVAGVVVIVT